MTFGALAAFGMPPMGHCIFARDDIEEGPWSHVAVNAERVNAGELVDEARRRGATPWFYAMPGRFRSSTWPDGLALLEEKCARFGVDAVIVDWEPDGEHVEDATAEAFGVELARLSWRRRVGITFHPSSSKLEVLARAAGFGCFGILQVYGRTSVDAGTIAGWWRRASSYFGLRLCLATALWESSDRIDTPDEFSTYLSRLPPCSAAWGWPVAEGRPPRFMLEQFIAWEPGGSRLGTFAQAALRAVVRPAFGVFVAFLVLLALVVFAVWRSRAAH